jgi:RecA-family ATPase
VAILFGNTGEGKTAFSVQVGNDIAAGRSSHGLEVEAPSQNVFYLDFELSDTQQLRRYSIQEAKGDGRFYYGEIFDFHENFSRV